MQAASRRPHSTGAEGTACERRQEPIPLFLTKNVLLSHLIMSNII